MKRHLLRLLSAFATFILSCGIAMIVENGMAELVWHGPFDPIRFVVTLVCITYVDARLRAVEQP